MIASKCALFIAVARLGSGVGLPGASGGGGSLSSARVQAAISGQQSAQHSATPRTADGGDRAN